MKHLHSLTILTCVLILISSIENKHRNKHHRVKKVPFNAADLAMEYYQQNTVNNVISNHLNQSPVDADPSNYKILNGFTKENDPLMKSGVRDNRFPEPYYPHYDPSLHLTKPKKISHYKPRPAIYEKDPKAYYRSTAYSDMVNTMPEGLKKVPIVLGDLSENDPSKASKEKIKEMQRQLNNLNNFIPLPKNMLKRDKGRSPYYPDPNAYYDPTRADTERQKKDLQNRIIKMRKNLALMEKNGGKIPNPFRIENVKGKIFAERIQNRHAESYNKFIRDMLEDEVPNTKQSKSQTPKAKIKSEKSHESHKYYKMPKVPSAKVQIEKEHRKTTNIGGINFSTISSNYETEKNEKKNKKEVLKNEMTTASNFDKRSNNKIYQTSKNKEKKDFSYSTPKMVSSVKGNNPWDVAGNLRSERIEIIDKNEKKEKKNLKKAEISKKTEKKAKKTNKKGEKAKKVEKKTEKAKKAKKEENKKEKVKRNEKKVEKAIEKENLKQKPQPKRKEQKVTEKVREEAKEEKNLNENKEEKPKRKEQKIEKKTEKKVEKIQKKVEKTQKKVENKDNKKIEKDQKSDEEEEEKKEKPARKVPNSQGLKTGRVKILHRKRSNNHSE